MLVQDGLLWRWYKKSVDHKRTLQLVVPLALQEELLKDLHEGVLAGHLGMDKHFPVSRIAFAGLGTTITWRTGVGTVPSAPGGRLLYQRPELLCSLSKLVILYKLLQLIFWGHFLSLRMETTTF